jgi:hypothetical protein
MNLILNRIFKQHNATIGEVFLRDNYGKQKATFVSLELPFLNNERTISCIPPGIYNCKPRTSKKFSKHFIVENVPNRNTILIHVGNYPKDTTGCILLGYECNFSVLRGSINITQSRDSLNALLALAPNGFQLTII